MTFRPRLSSSRRRLFPQCLQEVGQYLVGAAKFAFPNYDYGPACISQRFDRPPIPSDVAFKLGSPEFRARLGEHRIATARVAVPETAVYKYTGLQARQYNIRLSGKVCTMKPETESVGMQEPAHQHFGLGVLPPYGRHHSRPAGGINYVHFAQFRYSVVS